MHHRQVGPPGNFENFRKLITVGKSLPRFVVTGGAPVPIICGRNTGHHMYIDAGSGNSPTSITFITTGNFERAFKMKITQIECGAVNRGVEGCLQYHTGVSGTIASFNYIGKLEPD